MIDSYFLKTVPKFNLDVSRETLERLDEYSKDIILKNKEINLISKSTESSIKSRHIADSMQTIDFIDKNDIRICTDLGSGAGLPGIVLGIIMSSKKPTFKVIFYEKSYHKSNFLKEMSKKFNLDAEIYQKNIFNEEKELDIYEEKNQKVLYEVVHSKKFRSGELHYVDHPKFGMLIMLTKAQKKISSPDNGLTKN